MSENKFEKEFTEEQFWEKVKTYARVAGENVLEPALTMYQASKDATTPGWAKTVIYGSIGACRA